MTELWKRISYRLRSDGPLQFTRRAIDHVISNPSSLLEPVYQVIKPSWTTLHLNNHAECEFTLDPATISARDFREAFESEREIVADLLEKLNADDVFWDVGANVGVYTCFASANISDGSNVIAFEPHPEIRSYLEANVDRNTPDSRIVPCGLSNEPGTQRLSEIGLAAHTIVSTDDHSTIDVELDTAKGVVENYEIPSPTVVKLDIEGAELLALEGFGDLIEHVRLLYCEIHPKRLEQQGHTGQDVEEFLKDSNFDVQRLDSRGSTYFVRCIRSQD